MSQYKQVKQISLTAVFKDVTIFHRKLPEQPWNGSDYNKNQQVDFTVIAFIRSTSWWLRWFSRKLWLSEIESRNHSYQWWNEYEIWAISFKSLGHRLCSQTKALLKAFQTKVKTWTGLAYSAERRRRPFLLMRK